MAPLKQPHRTHRAGQHSSEKNQNGAHAFPILRIFQVFLVALFLINPVVGYWQEWSFD
ncbi:hypothetical protein ACNKHO_21350 [Shigella flexneri]